MLSSTLPSVPIFFRLLKFDFNFLCNFLYFVHFSSYFFTQSLLITGKFLFISLNFSVPFCYKGGKLSTGFYIIKMIFFWLERLQNQVVGRAGEVYCILQVVI